MPMHNCRNRILYAAQHSIHYYPRTSLPEPRDDTLLSSETRRLRGPVFLPSSRDSHAFRSSHSSPPVSPHGRSSLLDTIVIRVSVRDSTYLFKPEGRKEATCNSSKLV